MNLSRITLIISFLIAPPAFSATQVHFDSATRDYIGAGQENLWISPGDTINFSNSNGYLTVNVGGYMIRLETPNNNPFEINHYQGATRYPFNATSSAGLSVSGNGRGCNMLGGHFDVIDVVYNGYSIESMAFDFVQYCENKPYPLFGEVRINSDVPVERNLPYALAGVDTGVIEGDDMVLTGRGFINEGTIIDYEWLQLSGPEIEIETNQQNVNFIAPAVLIGGDDIVLQLTVTDDSGQQDSDTINIHVSSKSDPQTYLYFNSEKGDYIGDGKEWFYDAYSSGIKPTFVSNQTIQFAVTGGNDWWYLDFDAPDGESLEPGLYENATRYPFNPSNAPGLSFSGNGSGCNTLTGDFTVITNDTETNAQTGAKKLNQFAADFEQHCEGSTAALKGKIRYNAVDPSAPTADAGEPMTVYPGREFLLSGSGSADSDGVISEFYWQQIGGPIVNLGDGLGEQLYVQAPASDADSYTLTFLLRVTDDLGFMAEDTVEITVENSVDLAVAMTGKDGKNHKGLVTFEVNVTNNGFTTASGSVLTLPMPAETHLSSIEMAGAKCEENENVLSCQLPDITPGASLTGTVVVSTGAFTFIKHNYRVTVENPNDHQHADNTVAKSFGGSLTQLSLVMMIALGFYRKRRMS